VCHLIYNKRRYTGWIRYKCPTGEKQYLCNHRRFWYQNVRFYGGEVFCNTQI